MPRQLYGRTVIPFFACLTFRTERDIFSIRTPFDEVNIPLESGRRYGRNGTGFVTFRALSFLSIFQALSGFWIRFRISKFVLVEDFVEDVDVCMDLMKYMHH
jgi:hypothetical protein